MEKKVFRDDFNGNSVNTDDPLFKTEQVVDSLFHGVFILGNNIVKIDGKSQKEKRDIEVRLHNTENQFGPSRFGVLIAVIIIHKSPDDGDLLSSNRYELRYINNEKVLCERIHTTEGFERKVCDNVETLQVGDLLADSTFYETSTE